MKENKYDEDIFFEKYGQMLRSQKGLQGAGEWSEFQKLLPDFKQKTVLDLGCGYGWHCKYAAAHGAKQVLGTDISKKMLKRASEINADKSIQYRCCAMEDLCFDGETFDIVLSSLAMHYVADFKSLASKIYTWLKKGGVFVFSVEHPVYTANKTQDWYYDKDGNILHFPVDNYYYEGKRDVVFLGERVIKYHRTLTAYLETLLHNGMRIQHVIEPMPPQEMRELPEMREEMRRPMMLLISAIKEE